MSSTKEEIALGQIKEPFGEKASSQSALIIQESLSATPVVRLRRSSSRSRPRLVAMLVRELATVAANVRTISRQNVAM